MLTIHSAHQTCCRVELELGVELAVVGCFVGHGGCLEALGEKVVGIETTTARTLGRSQRDRGAGVLF